MKRLIVTLILCFLTLGVFAQSYEIETSRGMKVVQVPEGYTMEEAFLAVSKLYLEERFDHEDLIKEVEELPEKIDTYIEKNEILNQKNKELILEYENLDRLYRKELRPRVFTPFLSLGYHFDIENNTNNFHGAFGGFLFETISLQTIISYPLGIGVSIGVQL